MNITAGTRVLIHTSPRDWNKVGQAYQVLSDLTGETVAHVQWNAGYVTTVPVSQLVRW